MNYLKYQLRTVSFGLAAACYISGLAGCSDNKSGPGPDLDADAGDGKPKPVATGTARTTSTAPRSSQSATAKQTAAATPTNVTSSQDSDAGVAASGSSSAKPAPSLLPPPGTTQSSMIGKDGGTVNIPGGASVKFQPGTFDTTVPVTVTVLTPDKDAPEAVDEVTGVEIELGDKVLTRPAEVTLNLPAGSTADQVFVVANTARGALEVPVNFKKTADGGLTATFSAAESGRYAVVQIVLPEGCDKVVAKPATTASTDEQLKTALKGITRVTGNLSLSGQVTSVADLECLVRIDGALNIQSTALTSLEGLKHLAFVGGAVNVTSNTKLKTAELPSMLTARGGLTVSSNSVLTDFSADSLGIVAAMAVQTNGTPTAEFNLSLRSLKTVDGFLLIERNRGLHNLDGFGGLQSTRGLTVYSNPELENLDGLGRLSIVEKRATGQANYYADRTRYLYEGDVLITLNDSLKSASGLTGLETVDGNLFIASNPRLETVDLPALTDLGGTIDVDANAALESFSAESLVEVKGALGFFGNGDSSTNTALELERLEAIGGDLVLTNNPALTSLSGLPALLSVAGRVIIGNNDALEELKGLETLSSVGVQQVASNEVASINVTSTPGFEVSGNARLKDLDGLTGLSQISGGIKVTQNSVLTNINLRNLRSLGQGVEITQNPVLGSVQLSGLAKVPAGITFETNGNAATPTVLAAGSLTSVEGNVSIKANPSLANLDELNELSAVTGAFIVQQNPTLTNVNGLAKLQTVGANFSVATNALLADLNGLSALRVVGADFAVQQNVVLTSINLSSLAEVLGTLDIITNVKLADVQLPKLTRLTEGCRVTGNTALQSLTADVLDVIPSLEFSTNGSAVTSTLLSFGKLKTVSGQFKVTSNTSLNGLSFPVLNAVGQNFIVTGNTLLPTCAAVSLRDQIMAGAKITGTVTISTNLTDTCNPAQVTP